MLAFTHPDCIIHDTGPDHPEQAARLTVVLKALQSAYPNLEWREAPIAKLGDLRRVHDDLLIENVLSSDFEGYRMLAMDTVVCPDSRISALRAAGAGLAAVDAVMRNECQIAFCAVRPPGHHASRNAVMGFCLFNNIAIAAAYALEHYELERIAIIDFDVHHGNGTQAIFEQTENIAYFSTHQSGLYPHTGSIYERGVGNIYNAPLPPGCTGFRFRNTWADELLPAICEFQPQLIMISAGFDGHRCDPMAELMLEAEDYLWITRELRIIANRYSEGRIISMLEGGYDLQALAESCLAHVSALQ